MFYLELSYEQFFLLSVLLETLELCLHFVDCYFKLSIGLLPIQIFVDDLLDIIDGGLTKLFFISLFIFIL